MSTARRRATDVVAVLPRRPGVAIGSRWTPAHAIVRDPDSGMYFERNPPMDTAAELDVQKALLTQRENNRWRYWAAAMALPVAAYFLLKGFAQ
jgi:hypothetical protein